MLIRKSQVATIRLEGGRGAEQIFRYAPLSSGLDIVRKTLGQHGIATIQTTAIDQGAGVVNLTTVLAHASGEWIAASDWPVCAVSETATPHRMGAALTYARRYALFTLVGIAGEDDLDAPDLAAPTNQASEPKKPQGLGHDRLNGGQHHSGQRMAAARDARVRPAEPALGHEASAQLRQARLATLEAAADIGDAPLSPVMSALQPSPSIEQRPAKPVGTSIAHGIDKSRLAHPEPRRVRDKDHVKFVAKQPCLLCGRRPSDAHHLRFAQHPALGRKVSDEFTVPLCRGHHREVHRCGDEAAWWQKAGLDPVVTARALWLKTHPLPAFRENRQRRGGFCCCPRWRSE